MALNSSEIASNRPCTSVLIFGGISELIVLTLVADLALANGLPKLVTIPLQRENTAIELII